MPPIDITPMEFAPPIETRPIAFQPPIAIKPMPLAVPTATQPISETGTSLSSPHWVRPKRITKPAAITRTQKKVTARCMLRSCSFTVPSAWVMAGPSIVRRLHRPRCDAGTGRRSYLRSILRSCMVTSGPPVRAFTVAIITP